MERTSGESPAGWLVSLVPPDKLPPPSPAPDVATTTSTPAPTSPAERDVVLMRASEFRGPLPSPETLKGYGEIDPTFPNRLMVMTEKEQRHRQRINWAEVASGFVGQAFALTVAVYGLYKAGEVALNGHPWAGVLLGAADLVGLVSAFMYGSHLEKAQRSKEES